jgi:Ca2+-binding RTX toxin-like protein
MDDRRLRGALLPAAVLVAALIAPGPASAALTITDAPRPKVFVVGDAAPDEIRIECVQDQLKVNGSDPSQAPASCAALIELHVTGGGGNDTLDLSALDLGLIALHDDDPTPQVTVAGGEGNDTLLVGGAVEEASGGPGADFMLGSNGPTVLNGGPGTDRLLGGQSQDVIIGGGAADVLNGRGGKDFMIAEGGADRLVGGKGRDTAFGGTGADEIIGDSGRDILAGEPGRDLLRGGSGDDKLFGGKGLDRLIGGPGDDKERQSGGLVDALFEGIGNLLRLISAAQAGPS